MLDAFRLILTTLFPFPIFLQSTLLFMMAHETIAQQTFEANATYILPQVNNILAHFNSRTFAANREEFECGASEDDVR